MNAAGMQCKRRRQHDEPGDQVRCGHADEGVDAKPEQLPTRLPRRAEQRARSGIGLFVLDFLGSLPEEQVRADGRPENGDDHRQRGGIESQRRRHRRPQGLTPVHVHDRSGGHVCEQRSGENQEHAGVTCVAHPNLQHERDAGEERGPGQHRAAAQQLRGRAHRADVGPDVDGVGDHQQAHEKEEDPARISALQVCREPVAGHPADARGDFLDRRHQRVGQRHRPQQPDAELRSCLRIRRDAARVVVGRAGDDAGAEDAQPSQRRPPSHRSAKIQPARQGRNLLPRETCEKVSLGRASASSAAAVGCGSPKPA